MVTLKPGLPIRTLEEQLPSVLSLFILAVAPSGSGVPGAVGGRTGGGSSRLRLPAGSRSGASAQPFVPAVKPPCRYVARSDMDTVG